MRIRTRTLCILLSLRSLVAAAPFPGRHPPARPEAYLGLGHTRPITAIAWSPDGRTLATGSEDRTIVLWDAATRKPRATLVGYSAAIRRLAWSPDSRILAGSDSGSTAFLWEAATGRRQAMLALAAVSMQDLFGSSAAGLPGADLADNPDLRQIRTFSRSPDGGVLAGIEVPYVLLWDARTGARRASIKLGDVDRIAWSHDGRILAATGGPRGEAVSFWDRRGRHQGGLAWPSGYLVDLTWSPDGRWLAAADDARAVLLWDWPSRRRRVLAPRQEGIAYDGGALAWSLDGRTLASERYDAGNDIVLWSPRSARAVGNLKDPDLGIVSLLWSPDGRTLAVQGLEQVALWDAASRKRRAMLQPALPVAAWSPDGHLLVTGTVTNTAVIWDARTGRRHGVIAGRAAPVARIAWSPDGTQFAAGTDDPEEMPASPGPSREFVTLWDAGAGRPRSRLIGLTTAAERTPPGAFSGPLRPLWTPPDRIYDLSWSPDGSTVATATGVFTKLVPDGTGYEWAWLQKAVMLWDAKTGQRRATLPGALAEAAWSPDGNMLATGGGGSVLLWDPGTAHLIRKLPGWADVWRLAWSPDRKTLATPVFQGDHLACSLWDTTTWEQRAALPAPGHWYPSVAWSPTGTLLAIAADDRQATVWNAGTGALRQTLILRAGGLPGASVGSDPGEPLLAWSPKGRLLATASTQENRIKVWDAATDDLRAILTGASACSSLQWCPNGSTLAAVYPDCTVVLWDPVGHSRRAILRGHTGPITAMAWSPDGRMLATASEDGSLRLWDGTTGRERVALYSLDDGKEWLAITPGGYFAASARGADLIEWRQDGKLWPLARFRRRFERPDLVRGALGGRFRRDRQSPVGQRFGHRLPARAGVSRCAAERGRERRRCRSCGSFPASGACR